MDYEDGFRDGRARAIEDVLDWLRREPNDFWSLRELANEIERLEAQGRL